MNAKSVLFSFTLFWLAALLSGSQASGEQKTPTWVSAFENEILIVGNYPERITYPGNIAKIRLEKRPVRIMYYYQNMATTPLYINVAIKNVGDSTGNVVVTSGFGGPDADGLFAGFKSSEYFFRAVANSIAKPIQIGPRDVTQLAYQLVKPGTVVSGLIRIQNSGGDNLNLSLDAVEAQFEQFLPVIPAAEDQTPHMAAVLSDPMKHIYVQFSDQDILKEIPIGAPPYLRDPDSGIVVKGDYAVPFDVSLELINRSDQYKNICLLFSRIGGIARASMILDGVVVNSKHFGIADEVDPELLKTFTLPPHSVAHHRLLTIPLAGSFYPVKFVLRHQDLPSK